MSKRKKSKNKGLKWTILFIILDLLAIGGFVMMYGPWDKVRNFYVNTAMKTKDHQYLAKVFYRNSAVCILFYDITKKQSFEELKNFWIKDIKANASPNTSN